MRRRVSGQKTSGEEPKAASAKESNKENAPSGSKHSSSKKEDAKSSDKKDDNKSTSKKEDKKSDSKSSNDKAADAEKVTDEHKSNGDKPQNSSDPDFTPEDDAKILLMISEGKKMPEIAEAIGKTLPQTGQRYNQIKKGGKQQKGGKHGNDKADGANKKNDKATQKQVVKAEKKAEDRSGKSKAIDMRKQEQALSAAVLLGGKLEHQHQHAHAHRLDVHHHVHDSAHIPHHSRSRSRPHKSHHRAAASVTPSSRTAYTIKTMPSLAEDDLFSFGELQALSELIGKDMEGMWHRVSAAFFSMTGRRIAAEDIREKFADLETE